MAKQCHLQVSHPLAPLKMMPMGQRASNGNWRNGALGTNASGYTCTTVVSVYILL